MTGKPNVLFLVLDAVRTDHVSCYGSDRETTPNLDALAAEGVKYDNAIAPSIWTPTVHGSIFTGQYPSHTGIYGNSLGIPDDEETLPEALQAEGYRTFAASAGAHIRASRGYARGVDDYVETRRIGLDADFFRKVATDRSFARQVGFTLTRGPDDKTFYKYDRLERFMSDAIDDDQPFFGFINAKTAHQPFNPPRPYKRLFCEELSRPPYEFIERGMEALGMRAQKLDGYDTEKIRQVSHSGGDGVLAGEVEMSEREWDVIRAWYDGAIRYLDYLVGTVVEFLKARDAFEDTLVVVTSDHGDNFGDHGLTSHIFCLYETLVHVPLVISPPGDGPAGETVESLVTLADLEPTFREAAGAPLRDYDYTESLLDFEDRQYHEYVFSEYAGYDGPIERLHRKYPDFDATQYATPLQSIRDDEYKLIVDGDGNRELYAWREDRAETTDLAEENSEVADDLEERLRDHLEPLDAPGDFEEPDDPELQQQLKDLGYL